MATNPWTKKNPWLSLWLSGANTVLSHARGQAMAEAQRQANAMMNQSFEQMMRWWGGPCSGWACPRRSGRSRRWRAF